MLLILQLSIGTLIILLCYAVYQNAAVINDPARGTIKVTMEEFDHSLQEYVLSSHQEKTLRRVESRKVYLSF